MRHGRRQPKRLRFALPVAQTRLQALRAHGEIQQLRRALQLYRAQREFVPPEDFAERVRRWLEASPLISSSSPRSGASAPWRSPSAGVSRYGRAVRIFIVVLLFSSCGRDTTRFVPNQNAAAALTPERPAMRGSSAPGASGALDAGGEPDAGGPGASTVVSDAAPIVAETGQQAGSVEILPAPPDAGPVRVCARFLPIPLPAGFSASTTTHLSGDGLLVVANGGASIAYAHRWQQDNSMLALSPGGENLQSTASAVNRDGSVIAGSGSSSTGPRALLWDGNAVASPLPELTAATAVSADGSIVLALDASGFVRWTASGVERITTLSAVNGMSADGRRLAGTSVADDDVADRAVLDTGESVTFVGLPDELSSRATLISEDGQVVVGTSIDGGAEVRVFRWQAGVSAVVDGLVEALDVNADGSVIVGSTSEQCASSAGIWRSGQGVENLGCLLPAPIVPAGWRLLRATSVSDDGRIVSGSGVNPDQVLQNWVAVLGDVCPE